MQTKISKSMNYFFLSGSNPAKCCKSFRGLEGLGVETIRFPTGNVVFNVIGNAAPFHRVAYDVFVETGLPSKRYLIGVGKRETARFIPLTTTDNQPRRSEMDFIPESISLGFFHRLFWAVGVWAVWGRDDVHIVSTGKTGPKPFLSGVFKPSIFTIKWIWLGMTTQIGISQYG